jgi:DnaJ-class molecular chaperone
MRQRTIIDDFLEGLVEFASDFAQERIEQALPRARQPRRKNIKPPKAKATPKTPSAAKPARSLSTHYETLQVLPTADDETISAAYRSLCKRAHPDNWPSAKDEHRRQAGEFRMKLYTEAYSILKDPAKRKAYDKSIREVR